MVLTRVGPWPPHPFAKLCRKLRWTLRVSHHSYLPFGVVRGGLLTHSAIEAILHPLAKIGIVIFRNGLDSKCNNTISIFVCLCSHHTLHYDKCPCFCCCRLVLVVVVVLDQFQHDDEYVMRHQWASLFSNGFKQYQRDM